MAPTAANVGSEETVITTFLQRAPSGRRRSRDALWLLARYMCCEEAYLYRVDEKRAMVHVASIPDERDQPELVRELTQSLSRMRALQSITVTVTSDVPAEVSDAGIVKYRLLPITAAGAQTIVGIAALREGAETAREISDEMLTEIGQVLAEDIRAAEAPTSLATRA